MNTLPPLEYNEKHPSITYSVNDKSQYSEFLEEFTAYVSGDCHAITIDNEILYNSYDYNEKSVREIIQEKAIRTTIIDDPHSIFVQLFMSPDIAHFMPAIFFPFGAASKVFCF